MQSDQAPSAAGSAALSGPTPRVPELLAPAGDWQCAKAAVENGADAIYFGLEKFNARMRAQNFTERDLPKLMEFLHRRGVKGYVTFNTLVFENELPAAEQYLRAMISAGVDAAIVQDVGICRLIRQLSPDFPIHVSTQMTVTSARGVQFAKELGCNLVVLARECSLKEIEQISKNGTTSIKTAEPHSSLPLEVFVHGALCVAYSGQCLTSEALGGRSANRGECAQACRMPYDLVADGKQVSLGDRRYLLSPQDLAGVEVLPELVRLGVASLKIEGRLKTPEYVANITRIYRNALDQLAGASSEGARVTAESSVSVTALRTPRYDLEMAFSRGLYTGWFLGTNNQKLVHARFGKKRGVYLGEITAVRHNAVMVRLEAPLKRGDGVVFDAGKPEEKEEGGRVYQINVHPSSLSQKGFKAGNPLEALGKMPVWLSFGDGDINFSRVHTGDRLWKTSDPELDRRLRQTFAGEQPRFQRFLHFEVHGRVGEPLKVIARDELGHSVALSSSMPLREAERQPLDRARLSAQLGRLGGSAFQLGTIEDLLEGELMLPVSELNRLRRDAVEALENLRVQPKHWTLKQPAAASPEKRPTELSRSAAQSAARGSADLIVLVRTLAQLEAAMSGGISTIYCEFEDPKKYPSAVESFRKSPNCGADSTIWVAPPRIFKMGEEWTLKQVRSCEADGYLVRNYDQLDYFAGDRRVGDFSLNIANHLSADYFKNRFGLERITASYDLNFVQLQALLAAASPEWFEVTIHQHMPMFHMEHCVFCAFLSSGTDYTNCGRPCDHHDLKLRDRVGAEHPVKADVGCRNTVFNALAQTGADYVPRMLESGVRHFRLEFLNESPEQVRQTIEKYRQLLEGQISGTQLWRELKLLNQLGVTRGQLGMAES